MLLRPLRPFDPPKLPLKYKSNSCHNGQVQRQQPTWGISAAAYLVWKHLQINKCSKRIDSFFQTARNPRMESKQQYCLKWNNHKSNISGVFDRLRNHQRFVDVTLASADHQTIKCHRLLLSAGSGYLEKILEQNPSDHPTVVLSQINHHELVRFNSLFYGQWFLYT